ncbi:HAAS signaling domain-containing protein [Streptomyces chattanoogensis]|uniref:HAAS signaling domain-containing protein n=1 Tax=Streptomyces chattanoogensis TaxID=66876 RepID=UPI0006B68B08|nr:hypothetical protein [Streptomyces chattanoogensis]
MTITEHPLAKKYLAAVARETAALSPERRNELLADLEEHIAVALVEESASGDDEIRAVLARLGDPRTIAATALGEEAAAPRPSLARALALLVLLAMTAPLSMLTPYPLLGCIPVAGAIWWLWTSRQWSRRDKVIGTVAAVVPLLFAVAESVAVMGDVHLGFGALFLPVGLLALVLPVAAGVYLLARAVRRPA